MAIKCRYAERGAFRSRSRSTISFPLFVPVIIILPPLRSIPLRSLAQLPLALPRSLWLRTHHLPDLKILLMIPEEVLPMLHLRADLGLGLARLPLAPDLALAAAQLPVLLLVVDGDEHLLDAVQVRGQVLLEAARDEGAGGVAAREEVVAAAGPVHGAVGGDVEDGAVDGEVDGEGGVGAVVEGELLGGEVEGAAL